LRWLIATLNTNVAANVSVAIERFLESESAADIVAPAASLPAWSEF